MISQFLRLNIPIKDKEFDSIYPLKVREMSKRHFTPIDVAIKAAQFLITKPNQKVLDIGCGVGKFCFVASSYSNAIYTGVDYRPHFIALCIILSEKHRFKNVNFIYSDIIKVDFSEYDAFYFFNSFLEQTDSTARLDDTVETNFENYKKYTAFLKEQFTKKPIGTRVVTYHGYNNQLPESYKLVKTDFDGLLKCWEKRDS